MSKDQVGLRVDLLTCVKAALVVSATLILSGRFAMASDATLNSSETEGDFSVIATGAGAGNANLYLRLSFLSPTATDRGYICATRSKGTSTQFAFFVVLEKSLAETTSTSYPFKMTVNERGGTLSLSVRVEKFDRKLAYSILSRDTGGIDESISIEKDVLGISDGRVFVVGLESDAIVVRRAIMDADIQVDGDDIRKRTDGLFTQLCKLLDKDQLRLKAVGDAAR